MAIAFKNPETQGSGETDDVVGRFRSGFQTDSGLPVSLNAFRITTGDPEVAGYVVDVMGSSDDPAVTTWETSTEEKYQVFTDTNKLDIILEPGSVRATLTLWSNKGKKIVETDGTWLIEDGKVTDKAWDGASKSMGDIKQAARDGVGPSPSLQAYFRIADAPVLGKFKYFSGSWTAIDNFNAAEAALDGNKEPQRATLELERVEFTAKDGTEVSYVRPQIIVLGEV